MKLRPVALRLRPWQWGVGGAVFLLLVGCMALVLPPAVDFHNYFRPAALGILKGISPYENTGFFNAPWTLLPLLPIALLPESLGRAVLVVVAFLTYAFTAYRLGGKPLAVVFFLLSPTVLADLLNGNLDWLAMVGYVLPHPVGLFFLAVKPQIGAVVGLFWLIEAWREGGWRRALRVFGPFAICLGLSFIIFGLWPLRFQANLSMWWNASLWPMSIPVGLVLLTAALRKRNQRLAMAAAPCLSPYLLLHSWSPALLAIIDKLPETIAAVVGLWILVAFRAASGG